MRVICKMVLKLSMAFFPFAFICEEEAGVGQTLFTCDRKSHAGES